MSEDSIRLVKYVFLDIVAYTKRTIEAQCDVINALNEIVLDSLEELSITYAGEFGADGDSILIPTGDGICIAIVNTDLQFDIHIALAQLILRQLSVYNYHEGDDEHKFKVRIGINQSDDNIIKDINSRTNVTGRGINNARRIMDFADGNQILVSRVVYDSLCQRKVYVNAFKKYVSKDKHGFVLDIYQFIKDDVEGLDLQTPERLASNVSTKHETEPSLSSLSAYYFALCIKNREYIENTAKGNSNNPNRLVIAIWFLALQNDIKALYGKNAFNMPSVIPRGCSDSIDEVFNWVKNNFTFENWIWIVEGLQGNVATYAIKEYYIEPDTECLVINKAGVEKLKKDWPDIWREFGLEKLTHEG